MLRNWKVPAIALLALLTLVPAASAQRRSVVVVRGGYGYYAPGWWGPGWGWYDPYPWGWWGPPYYAYVPVPNTGDVKIVTESKDASVYVDGGFAGVAGKLKKFHLPPGNHDIELRDRKGHAFHKERVHVIPGKTVEVNADLHGR
jgi:hypothetical protein